MTIVNRYDCCQERLGYLEVYVAFQPQAFALGRAMALCVNATAPATAGAQYFACSTPAAGRYVTLLLPGAWRTININELYVHEGLHAPPLLPSPPSLPPEPPSSPRIPSGSTLSRWVWR